MSTDYTAKAMDDSSLWEVPSGNKKHAATVSFFTFMSAILSALSIVFVSIRHSSFETDDNKQSWTMTFLFLKTYNACSINNFTFS